MKYDKNKRASSPKKIINVKLHHAACVAHYKYRIQRFRCEVRQASYPEQKGLRQKREKYDRYVGRSVRFKHVRPPTDLARSQLEAARPQFFWNRSSFVASIASCSCRACSLSHQATMTTNNTSIRAVSQACGLRPTLLPTRLVLLP